jgi:hypothetical protein
MNARSILASPDGSNVVPEVTPFLADTQWR